MREQPKGRRRDSTTRGEYTGRLIVVFADVATSEAVASLTQAAGLRVATSSDYDQRVIPATARDTGSAMLFEALGIAVVDAPAEQLSHIGGAAAAGMQVIRERYMFATGAALLDEAYLNGLEDGAAAIVAKLKARWNGSHVAPRPRADSAPGIAAADFTWNLARVGVSATKFAGRGIRIAVLDTGYDAQHPDFAGRSIIAQSFVPNATVQDGNGHGTHCLGLACGGRKIASTGPLYGCAPESEILVGKVLGDNGRGAEGWVLNGINWAIEQGAQVVSLSIEGPAEAAPQVMTQYEAVGTRALARNSLLVAAAGNRSARPLFTRPVASPANASTIMAVAALSPDDSVAPFSCAGRSGSKVDIAAPGVSIDSSFPMPRGRRIDSGTSMATPQVAGIAALFAESDAQLRGKALWKRMEAAASALADDVNDVGAGCVQAP